MVTANLPARVCLCLVLSVGLVGSVAVVGIAAAASATPVWSIVPSPNPTGSTETGLNGVSCPTLTSCFAVGQSGTSMFGSDDKSLVERWNGSRWSLMTSPNPTGSSNVQVSAVRCRSTTNCFAVGSYQIGGTIKALAEHWNGQTWSITSTPNRVAEVTLLSGVACPSDTSCFAVGFDQPFSLTESLVEHWNGHTWSVVASPNPTRSTTTGFDSVSCPTTTSCFAVGDSGRNSTKSLVEHWNGRTWSIMTSPNPTGTYLFTPLTEVACPTATSCFAAGWYGTTGITPHVKSLVEHWNGHTWSIMTSPNSPGSTGTYINALTCATTTKCFAVGDAVKANKSVVEVWNGHVWSIMTSPKPTETGLAAVTCPNSPLSCFAVGQQSSGTNKVKSLVERFR